MTDDMKQSYVVGVFNDLDNADAAVDDLLKSGFERKDIGFLIRHSEGAEHEREAEADEHAAITRITGGAVTGGLLGGLLGVLTPLLIPGVGPVLATGLMLLIGGGAIAGGFAGLISTMELSDEEVAYYEGELTAGRPIVVVETDGRYSEAVAILNAHGAHDVTRRRKVEEARR